MGKIKLKLVSGASVEKPLISAFSVDGFSYVILDNEMNGSMGLPIILVCKLENNKLTKIADQEEWGKAKEYLKNIIAGNSLNYIRIGEELSADDIYYTQLTLPVSSFDALKNSYIVVDNNDMQGIVNTETNNEMMNVETNNIEENTIPVMNNNIEPVSNIESEINMNIAPNIEPAVVSPIIDETPVNPVENNLNNEVSNNINLEDTISFQEAPINPEPTITPTPVIDTNISPNVEEDIFKEQKEAFMQACENMFDALVQKFKKELENK